MLPQQYCLRWRYHHSNLQTMFSQLLEKESFCDVALACEGKIIKAHKIVLSACSTYFETILSQYEEKDPILIMKDVKFVDIRCLVEFMYKGEINVERCHLATLLKTAEDLRIKGLAGVSWKDEEPPQSSEEAADSDGIQQAALPQVSTVMGDSPEPCLKRKRGRPPLDDYDAGYMTPPKIVHHDDGYSNDANSEQDGSMWEGEQNNDNVQTVEEPRIKVKKELQQPQESNDSFSDSTIADSRQEVKHEMSQKKLNSSSNVTTSSGRSFLTPTLEKEWSDVVKMNDYLSTKRRQQFWEEPFTKRVMDAIKTKNLEMKVAAELLGVSYGTLYGRYRDSYGCLKHPYRARDFWSEPTSSEILVKLRRKEMSLYGAAEQLNLSPQTLSTYLISPHQRPEDTQQTAGYPAISEGEMEEDEAEADSILPDHPSNQQFQQLVMNASENSGLANRPDITIVGRERIDDARVNNNSDHSETSNDQI